MCVHTGCPRPSVHLYYNGGEWFLLKVKKILVTNSTTVYRMVIVATFGTRSGPECLVLLKLEEPHKYSDRNYVNEKWKTEKFSLCIICIVLSIGYFQFFALLSLSFPFNKTTKTNIELGSSRMPLDKCLLAIPNFGHLNNVYSHFSYTLESLIPRMNLSFSISCSSMNSQFFDNFRRPLTKLSKLSNHSRYKHEFSCGWRICELLFVPAVSRISVEAAS